jgi:hypothetical protein
MSKRYLGGRNPHRSGLRREPRRFEETVPNKGTGIIPTIYENTAAAARARAEVLSARDRAADEAWEAALAPARLPLGHPDRVTYPEAVRSALSAYDEVIERHREALS